ncbi:shaggy-related protein kinase iota-like [Vigna umbellata]|uniref:shaggy-related protein kinase iota-like n=1 Tax=Vigna umbellata TaxID=87088 RepID=UPI001F5E51CC|nr:shaggy-related protein kinase iota-like [Vigna umbellata]
MASMPLGPQQQLQPPQVATPPQQLPQAENDPMQVDSRDGSDAASNKEMSAPVAEGNEAHGLTGHIISTTIGGKNGEPKRVRTF